MTFVLGIETSCDETAAAVVDDHLTVLGAAISTSLAQHQPFGGVVPELAGRAHLATITHVVDQALDAAGRIPTDPRIDAVAATAGPGLIGSLLVGLSAAKGYALSWGVPLVAVNHLEGHLFAPLLERPDLRWPVLTVLLSGGHSVLVLHRAPGEHEVLGETLDDAAGEAYDKVARWLGLGYPGGPPIDRLAQGATAGDLRLPAAMATDDLDLSFSGLKTAVVRATERRPDLAPADVARAFQAAVCEQVLRKTRQALEGRDVAGLALAGGVAANSALRHEFERLAAERGLECHLPALAMCTDNAAMIAAAGLTRLRRTGASALSVPARPNWSLADLR